MAKLPADSCLFIHPSHTGQDKTLDGCSVCGAGLHCHSLPIMVSYKTEEEGGEQKKIGDRKRNIIS